MRSHLVAPKFLITGASCLGTPPEHRSAESTTGWGYQTQPPAPLHYADLVQVERARCAAAGVGPDELCVGAPAGTAAGPCFGDNGSPSLQRAGRHWVAVGLQSRGIDGVPCGRSPSVMTNLAENREWIYRTISRAKLGSTGGH